MKYILSTDYAKLYEFICAGNTAAGFVDGTKTVLSIRKLSGFGILCEGKTTIFCCEFEEQDFLEKCKPIKLQWIAGMEPKFNTQNEKLQYLSAVTLRMGLDSDGWMFLRDWAISYLKTTGTGIEQEPLSEEFKTFGHTNKKP